MAAAFYNDDVEQPQIEISQNPENRRTSIVISNLALEKTDFEASIDETDKTMTLDLPEAYVRLFIDRNSVQVDTNKKTSRKTDDNGHISSTSSFSSSSIRRGLPCTLRLAPETVELTYDKDAKKLIMSIPCDAESTIKKVPVNVAKIAQNKTVETQPGSKE